MCNLGVIAITIIQWKHPDPFEPPRGKTNNVVSEQV